LSALPEHIEIEPGPPATATVILLHGLGADGHDLEPVVEALDLPESLPIRFILPHAPERALTINNGEQMRAWYDFIPHSETEGRDDIDESGRTVEAFIDNEIARGIPSERIVLAGFSQGGVIALHAGLRLEKRIAGIIALSTYLYDFSSTEQEMSDANLAIPILLAHGTHDPLIPIMRAATSRENLIRLGYDVRWHDYPMEHQICLEEVDEVSQFLREIL
jgi:phospholipase/carboxylesterase